MRTVLIGGYNDALSNAGSEYNCLSGGFEWNGTYTWRIQPIPTAGAISKLKVTLSAAPTNQKYTFTLMVNGVASALTCDVAVAATTGEDAVNSVNVAAGDTVCIRSSIPNGAPGNTPFASWSTIFTGTTAGESIVLGFHYNLWVPGYSGLHGAGYLEDRIATRSRIPTAGTFKKLYYIYPFDDADTATCTLWKNGLITDLAATFTSLVPTPDTVDTVAVVDDDYVQIRITGEVATAWQSWGMVFAPTVSGQFLFTFGNADNSLGNDGFHNFVIPMAVNVEWLAAETNYPAGGNGFTAKKIRAAHVAPGVGKSDTWLLRKYASGDTALTVTLSEAETSDSFSVDVAIADWDLLVLKHTQVGESEKGPNAQVSIVGYLAPNEGGTTGNRGGSPAGRLVAEGAI